ncbi:amino acid ABC transporter permease [Paenibacillus validus]|uniref:ABC transporter permease subunit n=1 Tax=Paenibacillus validus TaxID=44253 RepID=A0A7X2Z6N8_9BACL|nr:amino acid ABC transporter permease [Paenibacillus validus]MUG69306.1 ABC transporter permease subunit [Paenibacillus validus]
MDIDFTFMLGQIPRFIDAAVVTIKVGVTVIITSLLVGLLNTILLYYRKGWVKRIVQLYVEVARNTPLLIQLFFLYFALPSLGLKFPGYTTAIIAMTFLGGGYMTEVFRSGLEAVQKSQVESGLAIGLSKGQLLRFILLPQAIRISIPAFIGNFIFLLKETSVVSAIAIPELLYTTTDLIATYYKTFEMFIMLAAFYLILILPLSLCLSFFERKLTYGQFGN